MSPVYAAGPVHSNLSLRRHSPRLGSRLERGLVQGHLTIAPLRATATPAAARGSGALLELPLAGAAALERLGAATRPSDPLAARPDAAARAAKGRLRALDGRGRYLRATTTAPPGRPRNVFTA